MEVIQRAQAQQADRLALIYSKALINTADMNACILLVLPKSLTCGLRINPKLGGISCFVSDNQQYNVSRL